MAENAEDVSPESARTPNSGPWIGPAVRRIPGLVAAHSILERKSLTPGRLHVPRRPLWLCRDCGHPWPCGTARLRLRHEYAHDPISLRIYLASRMHESIRDLLTLDPHGAPTAEAFFTRFLAWAAPRNPQPHYPQPHNPQPRRPQPHNPQPRRPQ